MNQGKPYLNEKFDEIMDFIGRTPGEFWEEVSLMCTATDAAVFAAEDAIEVLNEEIQEAINFAVGERMENIFEVADAVISPPDVMISEWRAFTIHDEYTKTLTEILRANNLLD